MLYSKGNLCTHNQISQVALRSNDLFDSVDSICNGWLGGMVNSLFHLFHEIRNNKDSQEINKKEIRNFSWNKPSLENTTVISHQSSVISHQSSVISHQKIFGGRNKSPVPISPAYCPQILLCKVCPGGWWKRAEERRKNGTSASLLLVSLVFLARERE